MSSVTIKFHGYQDEILKAITNMGIAETKTEAIRMALLKFALDLGLMDSKPLLNFMRKELEKSKVSPEQVLTDIRKAKNDSISG